MCDTVIKHGVGRLPRSASTALTLRYLCSLLTVSVIDMTRCRRSKLRRQVEWRGREWQGKPLPPAAE